MKHRAIPTTLTMLLFQ